MKGFLLRLRAWWRPVRLYLRFLLPARFGFLILALIVFAFVPAGQGQDILRSLAEADPDGSVHWPKTLLFIASVSLLAGMLWYWTRQLLMMRRRGEPPASFFPKTATWLPRLLGAFAYVATIVSVLSARAAYDSSVPRPRRVLLIIAILLAICAIAFVFCTVIRRMWLNRTGAPSPTEQAELQVLTRRILLSLVALDVIFLLGAAVAPLRLGRIGSASIVFITSALWVAAGGLLVWFSNRTKFPVLMALMTMTLLFSGFNDNHAIRKLDTPAAPRPDLATYFKARYARLQKLTSATGRLPVFVVATEGGGIRAAYWTTTVLTHLQDTIPHPQGASFADHCFAISGVSGGSLGAIVFSALRAEEIEANAHGQALRLQPGAQDMLGVKNDALSPTLAVMLQPDAVQRMLPFPLFKDRAEALERAWEHAWQGSQGDDRFSAGFLGLYQAHGDALPPLFINGTMVEAGNRIITSNVHIGSEFGDALDGFDKLGSDIRLSTTALMSARFTYVSPPGTMKGIGHVVDGGYFENSGAATGLDVASWLQANLPVDVWVIVIKFGPDSSGLPSPQRFGNEFFGPMNAIFDTRDARGELAVADIRKFAPGRVLTFRLLNDGVPLPLGWLLSERSQATIDNAVASQENSAATATVQNLITTAAASARK